MAAIATRIPAADAVDGEDHPAYTMRRAAEMIGVSLGFVRSLEKAD